VENGTNQKYLLREQPVSLICREHSQTNSSDFHVELCCP